MNLEMTHDARATRPELLVLTLRGELDLDCAPALQAEGAAIVEGACEHLLLELDGLRHIDSKGLGTFLEMRQRMRGKGGTVSIVCNNPSIRRLFRITNLERLFEFFETVEQFLRARGERVSPLPAV